MTCTSSVRTDWLVSRNALASATNLEHTQAVDGDLVKVLTWYDNEWGYTNQMLREALKLLG